LQHSDYVLKLHPTHFHTKSFILTLASRIHLIIFILFLFAFYVDSLLVLLLNIVLFVVCCYSVDSDITLDAGCRVVQVWWFVRTCFTADSALIHRMLFSSTALLALWMKRWEFGIHSSRSCADCLVSAVSMY